MSVQAQSVQLATPASLRTLAMLCAIALVVGFAGNLAILLPNIVLEQAAASGLAIGSSTAAQALGIVVSGPIAVYLLGRAGSAHVMTIGWCIAAIGLAALSAAQDALPITLCRFVFAIGTGLMVIVSEYVVTARAPSRYRATLIAIYALCFTLGTAISPGLISLVGSNLPLAYAVALSALIAAAIGISSAGLRARVEYTSPWTMLGLVLLPTGSFLCAAFIYGILENGLLSLLTIYALRVGYSVADASTIAMASFIGVLLLQVPIGHLSDRTSPRLILFISTVAGMACLTALAVAEPAWPLMITVAFLLGGLCDAFYTVGLAEMSQRVPKSELAAGNACFVLFCGVGELIGPILAGSGLDALGPAGFIGAFIGVLAAYFAVQIATVPRPSEGRLEIARDGAP